MAEQIISASGTQYGVAVDKNNRMYVTGSITSMPSVSVSAGSESWIKGGSISVYNQVQTAGSIYSMPAVNVSAGSEQWIQNPVGISGTNVIGSVVIMSAPLIGVSGAIFDSGDITGSMVISSSTRLGVSGTVNVDNTVQIAGSIWSMPSISTGSEVYVMNPVGISGTNDIGSVVIKSAPLLGVSGAIFTNGNMTGSMAMKGIGSVIIQSSNKIGISGPVWVQNPIGISGTNMIGSVVISSAPLLGVSGLIFTNGNMTGSFAQKGIGSIVGDVDVNNLYAGSSNYTDFNICTGSVVVSSGFGSETLPSMYNTINWIGLKGLNSGSTYYFGINDDSDFMITSSQRRTGNFSFLTPIPVSGVAVFVISGAQVDGDYDYKVIYS